MIGYYRRHKYNLLRLLVVALMCCIMASDCSGPPADYEPIGDDGHWNAVPLDEDPANPHWTPVPDNPHSDY